MASNRFPPANWLRTFELVARYMSFSQAALHLHISTSAVSQQIKNLEEFFDCKLFRRVGNRLYLTESADVCLPAMHKAFSQLQRAVDQLYKLETREAVNVSVAPSFATKWLTGRLARFCDRHPDLDIGIFSTATLESFNTNEIDVAIRYGHGHYPGLELRKLMSESVVAVAAPQLVAEMGSIDSPEALLKVRLLHDMSHEMNRASPDWEMVANIFGLEDLDYTVGPKFNQSGLVLNAAIAGLGVGLVKHTLAREAIAAGQVVCLLGRVFESHHNYYAVCLPDRKEVPKIKAFIDWLEEEAKAV